MIDALDLIHGTATLSTGEVLPLDSCFDRRGLEAATPWAAWIIVTRPSSADGLAYSVRTAEFRPEATQ